MAISVNNGWLNLATKLHHTPGTRCMPTLCHRSHSSDPMGVQKWVIVVQPQNSVYTTPSSMLGTVRIWAQPYAYSRCAQTPSQRARTLPLGSCARWNAVLKTRTGSTAPISSQKGGSRKAAIMMQGKNATCESTCLSRQLRVVVYFVIVRTFLIVYIDISHTLLGYLR